MFQLINIYIINSHKVLRQLSHLEICPREDPMGNHPIARGRICNGQGGRSVWTLGLHGPSTGSLVLYAEGTSDVSNFDNDILCDRSHFKYRNGFGYSAHSERVGEFPMISRLF